MDIVNVWDENKEFCFDVTLNNCFIYSQTNLGFVLYGDLFPIPAPVSGITWRLTSTDGDGDGIPGVRMQDGMIFSGKQFNFNLNPPAP